MSLIGKLKGALQRPAQSQESDERYALRLANAVLLVEVSHADFAIDREELKAASARLAQRYDLTVAEAEALLADAAAEQRQSVSMHDYLTLINERMSPDGKVRLIEDLWFVAYADGSLDPHEEHRIRKIADLLYVAHTHFVRGRYRASKG